MASHLFSPLTLGGVTLPNRIVVSPMCQYAARDGVAQPWHWMHLGGLAVSGAGLVITESTAVEAIGRISLHCLGLYDDAQEAALTRLVADLRGFAGARLGVQLSHAGRKASGYDRSSPRRDEALHPEDGAWQTEGPSPIPYKEGWPAPVALNARGLARVRDAFADAARRADRCGFDLIELHGAHGYLLHAFLSPLSNCRADAYGGDLAARMRFPLEVVAAVRAAWPRTKALGMRINGDDWCEGGLVLDDAVAYARALQRAGLDYVTLSGGNVVPHARNPPVEPGYMVPFAERVRRETGMTTMAVGMICDPRQAEAVIAAGRADMVALGRAFLDDPRWGWHAAAALGVDVPYPERYKRAKPAAWPGYALAHGGSRAAMPHA